jgi:hypothetical protein
LIKLFRQFLNKKITINGLITDFEKLSQICDQEFSTRRHDFEKLIMLQFNDVSKGFHRKIISETYILCETFLCREDPFAWDKITEFEFRQYISNLLFAIQN